MTEDWADPAKFCQVSKVDTFVALMVQCDRGGHARGPSCEASPVRPSSPVLGLGREGVVINDEKLPAVRRRASGKPADEETT